MQSENRNIVLPRVLSLFPAPVRTVNGIEWGYINSKGRFIIKPQFSVVMDFQDNGFAIVSKEGKYGVINESGQFIVRPKYESIMPFSQGLAVVTTEKGYSVINEKGRIITQKAYKFIGDYENDFALVADTTEEYPYAYGYLNKRGRVAIPIQFKGATNFYEGVAVVQKEDDKFVLINQQGDILKEYDYPFVGEHTGSYLVFQQEEGGLYGYIEENGNVVISPQFQFAQPFQHDLAVVTVPNKGVGLIDSEGKFILKPKYSDIKVLDKKRYAVGRAINSEKPYLGSVYAVADANGQFLSEFIYYDITPYMNGFASANNKQETFFISKSGQIAEGLPVLKGVGSLHLEGDVVKAVIDDIVSYYTRDGKLLYRENMVITLNRQYAVKVRKFKPNTNYLVYYPQVQGMPNGTMERRVNEELKELSNVIDIKPDKQLEYSYEGDFSIQFFKKKLLVLKLFAYNYPFGAAHGMPSETYPHINLQTGQFHNLSDLFKEDSRYIEVLSDVIQTQIDTNSEYDYVFPDSYNGIRLDQPFYVNEKAVYIYFEPYEIAPYAAGFPTFRIPFKEIHDIINTSGSFWKSFH
ncbi:DUF3298 domain-containing protein [Bacillus sp. HMF5848]|uniref:WG repeat-containing protein n=1 Tax=Bacillus sp. HMF5848 TaxID=2495421 RepID=UPI000F7A8BF3|nr:WG repeat-containing protein [Bacillus sp. HMF5848]RSK26021.1 DUF3298 domain-containing protein [Bacillus sp. HMF5848]